MPKTKKKESAPGRASLTPSREIQSIDPDSLTLSERNSRKSYPEDSLQELANSIAQLGLLQPIHVLDDGEVMYGHRRLLAVRMLGLSAIDAIVHARVDGLVEHTDLESRRVVENLQREGLHPLDESEAILRLRSEGRSPRDVAALIGKPEAYVARRVALAELMGPAKEAYRSGGVTPWAAEAISRLSPEAQAEAWAYYTGEGAKSYNSQLAPNGDKVASNAGLQGFVRDHLTHRLDRAPFDLGDSPSCEGCPKRTVSSLLFALEEADDRCLDPVCWRAKVESHLTVRVAMGGLTPLSLCDQPQGEALGRDQWRASYGGDGLKGIIVDGSRAGEEVRFGVLDAPDSPQAQEKKLAEKKQASEERRLERVAIEQRKAVVALVGDRPIPRAFWKEPESARVLYELALAAPGVSDGQTFFALAKRRGWVPVGEDGKAMDQWKFSDHYEREIAPKLDVEAILSLMLELRLAAQCRNGQADASIEVALALGLDAERARSAVAERMRPKEKKDGSLRTKAGEAAEGAGPGREAEVPAGVPRQREPGPERDGPLPAEQALGVLPGSPEGEADGEAEEAGSGEPDLEPDDDDGLQRTCDACGFELVETDAGHLCASCRAEEFDDA